jgi:hypothetical protein
MAWLRCCKERNPHGVGHISGIGTSKGVLLSVLNSLKVLVSKGELKNHRGAGGKHTLITLIKCVSMDSLYLNPLII